MSSNKLKPTKRQRLNNDSVCKGISNPFSLSLVELPLCEEILLVQNSYRSRKEYRSELKCGKFNGVIFRLYNDAVPIGISEISIKVDEEFGEMHFSDDTKNAGFRYLQINKCINPFCRNFGRANKTIPSLRKNIQRYKSSGQDGNDQVATLYCNPNFVDNENPNVSSDYSTIHSNYSLAEEIKRLYNLNTLKAEPINSAEFHLKSCTISSHDPILNGSSFVKNGKTKAGSQIYKCNICGKRKSIEVEISKSYNYYQQVDGVLLDVFQSIISHTPISKICASLSIGKGTFYNKLKIIYERCLAFATYHEEKFKKSIKNYTLLSDTMDVNIPYLSRLKTTQKPDIQKEISLNVFITCTYSGYVLRADIDYDFVIDLDIIEKDTMKTNEDLTYSYLRKHERLEYPFVPIENAKYDSNLEVNREEFITHSNYFVNGCRVKQSYCAMAHYFLIREMLSFKDIKFVTDNSSVLKLSIFKIFNEDFRNRKAVYLISQIQKNLSHEQEVKLISEQKRDLYRWGSLYHGNKDITKLVDLKYKDILKQGLFNDIEIDGKIYISGPKKPFKIPLDNTTDGIRSLQVISPIDHMSDNHIIKMFKLSSFRNHNFFIISLRRAIQALDRPNISARAHGRRHYLYTGKNPKYIQYFITIFRVYYNFVFLDKHGKTKAMREGIATKGFTLKDIIYFSR